MTGPAGSSRLEIELRRIGKFVIVGASNTVIGLVTYYLLLSLGVHYVASGAIAWTLGTINGYTWNRIWTFHRAQHRNEMAGRYLAVGLLGLGLNTALLTLLVGGLGVGNLPAELIALPMVVVITFSLNRFWTFGRHIQELELDPHATEDAVPERL